MTLRDAVKILSLAGIENAADEARMLFSELMGLRREALVFENPTADARTEDAVKRRAERVPFAYVLGYSYFYNEKYTVNESCLVPRQETELLVDFAVKNIPEGESFLDLCTGSGCIGISVLKNTAHTRAVLADLSESALSLAAENARQNGVAERAEFVLADVLSAPLLASEKVFAVLSNPPYVRDEVYGSLSPEVMCEPKMALVGGTDGADFYRRLTELYKDGIKEEGFILFEIGFDQGNILRDIAKNNSLDCEIIKDFSGLDRLALLKRKK
ncbi:MAG: peptide chain release factor N(5)-glutamine methyltransferase [Clostridia bacterium]|nr:peptide chain release factor N(5)-glutamine methyltransferase [Clostridia bacterium]